MMIKQRTPKSLKIQSQVRQLTNKLSFLDVLQDACAHNGRYTLTVEATGQVYTVLVDRGGPFNAIGGGTAGSPALVAAAQLRSGRCTITIGWPVDQPLYQPGLDLTMRALMEGAVAPSSLPRARGVDSLRNAEWRESEAMTPVNETWQRPAQPPIAAVTPPGPPAAPPAAPAPFRATAQPEPAAAQLETIPVQPLAVPSAFPTRPWVHPGQNGDVVIGAQPASAPHRVLPATDGVLPANDRVGAAVANAKHFATQTLLWLCEVEEPENYTLPQAAALARHNLVDGIAQGLHPFRHEMNSKIDRVKQDWARSAEVASRNSRKRRSRAVAAAATDPDKEFRLF
jgi:hypothetical protein